VSIRKSEHLAHKLNGTVVEIENAGHFNEAAGYRDFPFLLEHMNKHL